ncbi:terminal uridylyltransferase 7 [Denticeps clupeoides]|uniref:terminal uridylyltransferase 7 n=1 Tax=Denticeps clupeoides TaxID=299321 RepID=UPI0010A35E0F|nr:terminal uridylyltransferase 7 [Denticeps clupeoides]
MDDRGGKGRRWREPPGHSDGSEGDFSPDVHGLGRNRNRACPEESWPSWRRRPPRRRRSSSGERQGQAGGSFSSPGAGRSWRDRQPRDDGQVLVIDHATVSINQLLRQRGGGADVPGRADGGGGVRFSCHLCNSRLDSVSDAHRHLKDRWHRRRAKEKRQEVMLRSIPFPGTEDIAAVGTVLEDVVREVGMADRDVDLRRRVLALMQDVLASVLPDSRLRLYGSSCTRFGFRHSDVNIDVPVPPDMHQPDVLLLVKKTLSDSAVFVEVESDFHTQVPAVLCKEKDSGLLCRVSSGNERAVLTSRYLSQLAQREPSLLPLVLAFRHWARICHLDMVDEGGLPPYSLALMVICFLQQRKEPLLPAYLESAGLGISQLKNFSLVAVEEDEVLWVCKVDGDAEQRCGRVPLVFAERGGGVEPGRLWVEFLAFYTLDFQTSDRVVSVRTSAPLWRENKDWPRKRIAIEDPFAVRKNVARSVSSQPMFEYLLHCLRCTYKYFCRPPARSTANHGPAAQQAAAHNHVHGRLGASSHGSSRRVSGVDDSDCVIEEELLGEEENSEDEENLDEEECLQREERRWEPFALTTEEQGLFPLDEDLSEERPSDSEEEEDELEEEEDLLVFGEEESNSLLHSPLNVLAGRGTDKAGAVRDVLQYTFTKKAFTCGRTHTLVCSVCKHDGHLRASCPEDLRKLQLDPLPPMTPKFLNILNEVCGQCYGDFSPDELEEEVREHILQDLETFIRRHISGARLKLFGSSKNGFGFKESDLDICMVLEGCNNAKDLDCITIIGKLARVLSKHTGLRNIFPITTAKVPIVKFCHVKTGLEADISLYNTLALHNTHLLASYAAIDPRVRILCYIMKVFSKVCDIGDASRGSLSSYAYTLMVLFYLQQRDPPVVPVLQEIYDGAQKPEVLVDGWNVYFFRDLEDLPRRWPECGRNAELVGDLWLGLLRFYTEEFNFKEQVVCVRQRMPLTTFKKQWTSRFICIEDPFDLNHNLGGGLSRRMTNFIMKAFINGRRVFGSPIKTFPLEYPDKMEYFFDPEVLTEGEVVPNDRCCRVCGRVGHYMKDCPKRRKARPRCVSEEAEHGDVEASVKCCFICGAESHMKKTCPFRNGAGSPRPEAGSSPSSPGRLRVVRDRERQRSPPPEGKNKGRKKKKKVLLQPQAGSLTGQLSRVSNRATVT